MHDVAVLHHIVFAFDMYFSGIAACGFRPERYVVVHFDNFGFDKSFFKIAVDYSGALRSERTFSICPCSRFLGSRGEEGFEVEQFVGRAYKARHTRFFESEVVEKHLAVVVRFHFGDFFLSFCGDDKYFSVFVFYGCFYGFGVCVASEYRFFVHIADIQNRLVGEKKQLFSHFLFVVVEFYCTSRTSLFEGGFELSITTNSCAASLSLAVLAIFLFWSSAALWFRGL